MPRFARRRRNSRLLKMGTGTVHSTAISTVAITAVIFSFVERLRRPRNATPTAPPPYTRPLVLTL